MITDNALIEDFVKKLETRQKEVDKLIESVASRQKLYFGLIVAVNIVIFIVLQTITGGQKELIPNVDNTVINLVVTIALLFMPVPDAKDFGRKKHEEYKIDINEVEPHYDFSGTWNYITIFHLESNNDGSNDYKLARQMNFKEEGDSEWKYDKLGFEIKMGHTKEFKAKMEHGEVPVVDWHSSPVTISKTSIEWHFEGEVVKWEKGEKRRNDFWGKETYNVTERDEKGKPIKLTGTLKGFLVMDSHCYHLSADSEFTRNKI